MILDGFDKGAEEVFAAKERGEKLFKSDLARIMRTAVQAWQVANPAPTTRPPTSKRASVARNSLFDALAGLTGSDPASLTKTAARAVGVALAEIKEVCPDLTPEEINYRVSRYKQLHPQWPLTAMAICKNWADLGGGNRTASAKKDPYLPPPDNWQDTARKLWPSSVVAVTPWNELSVHIRSDILKALP